MPYKREFANKTSHSDIVKNPDISDFLENCDYLKIPTDEEGHSLAERFKEPPRADGALPNHIFAFDGSYYETSINDSLPSTKVGYVKIGALRIDLSKFKALRVNNGKHVDPFKVAELQDDNTSLCFALPSANIKWRDNENVVDSFREKLDESLFGPKTRFKESDYKTSLRSTLFTLAARRPGGKGTSGDASYLKLHKCPYEGCEAKDITLNDVPEQQYCLKCNGKLYPSDCLRLHEEVKDYQSNVAALSRFMNLAEILLPFHYIRYLCENSLESLASIAIFIDGPLAIFGTAAWIHNAIMQYLDEINTKLTERGLQRVLIVGLQKTGQIVDHVTLIDKYIPPNRLFCIDDDYRYTNIATDRDPSKTGFGSETYFGQDFVYKTPSGRVFCFGLPYPFASRSLLDPGLDFHKEKVNVQRYQDLPRALGLIHHFESDLYENAVVPIALAHKYTAISLVPGGKVLDILTRQALGRT